MSLQGPERPLGILVAVHEEAKGVLTRLLPRAHGKLGSSPFWRGTLGRREVALIQSGPGPARAAAACRLLIERQKVSCLLSVGLAGGLAEGWETGDVVLGARVLSGDGRGSGESAWTLEPGWADLLEGAAREWTERQELAGGGGQATRRRARAGTLVSQGRVIVSAREKRQLGERCGAVAVDMETRALVEAAHAAGLPWLAVRAISDPVGEDLPLDFNEFMDAAGNPSKLRILWEGIKRPALLGRLIAMEKTAAALGRSLAELLEVLAPRLPLERS